MSRNTKKSTNLILFVFQLRHHPLPRQEFFDNLVACASSQGFTIDTSSSKALADSLDKCVDANDVFMNRVSELLFSSTSWAFL